MENKSLYDYSVNDVSRLFYENVGAIIIVDPAIDAYKTIVRRGMFEDFLKESGIYHDLILDLWFHFSDTGENVAGDYQIFADNTGVLLRGFQHFERLVFGFQRGETEYGRCAGSP